MKLLLHTCCCPCFLPLLEILEPGHQISLYFFNPNIQPRAEFSRREKEVRRLAQQHGLELISRPYDPNPWFAAIRGLENEPEGGGRCLTCFRMRLEETCRRAVIGGFAAIASTLAGSRHKPGDLIDKLGAELAAEHGLAYVSPAAHRDRLDRRSRELCRDHAVYRQNYCGCVYSLLSRRKSSRGRSPV